jgi:hypothetical protein
MPVAQCRTAVRRLYARFGTRNSETLWRKLMRTLWHLTLTADGRQALFPTEALLRRALRILAETVGSRTLLFCIVDDHIHDVVCCSRTEAGRLGQSLNLALRPIASVPFNRRTDIRPVENRHHLERLVGYLLTQAQHHGLPGHPGLWSGSCFADLVGARVIKALGLPILEFLPRLRLTAVAETVGLHLPTADGEDRGICGAGAARIAAAASAALAVDPLLAGNSCAVVQARAAASVLAARAGIATRETASALGVSMRTTQRLALGVHDEKLLSAVRLRLALEDMVAEGSGTVLSAASTRCSRGLGQ